MRVQRDRSGSSWWNPSAWDPWHDFEALRRQVEQLAEAGVGAIRSTGEFSPAVDICDTGAAFLVRVDVPGVPEEDLDVALVGSLLAVKGCRASVGPTSLLRERVGGRFARTVALPAEVAGEEARATLVQGVLEIVVPKRSAPMCHRINVAVLGSPRD